MIIRCPKCKTGYNVPVEKFGPEGRTVRCSNCAHTWTAKQDEPKQKESETKPPLPPMTDTSKSVSEGVAKEIAAKKEDRRRTILAILAILFMVGAFIGLSQNILFGNKTDSHGTYITRVQESVNIEGLEIPEDSIERTLTEGKPMTLTFTGKVVNNTGASLRVPKIIVSLHDENGLEMDRWPAYVNNMTLAPGEETTWVCRFFDPMLDRISEHRVQFVKK